MSAPTITRRAAIASTAMAVSGLLMVPSESIAQAMSRRRGIKARLKELDVRSGGRLGVAVLNGATGQVVGNRIDERFAMCSTFKALAVAFVLARVDRGEESLDRRMVFAERDLVAPFTATQRRAARTSVGRTP